MRCLENTEFKLIELYVSAGADLRDVKKESLQTSLNYECDVYFIFNDKRHCIKYDDLLKSIK